MSGTAAFAMKLGIKQKILLVVVGVLALTSGLDALLASYLTNRQSERTAYADLTRDLLTWQADLQFSTARLRDIATAAVGDPVMLNQLGEVIALELDIAQLAGMPEFDEAARTLGYAKSVSLSRLQLLLRAGGFSHIAVYTGDRLSHSVSANEGGMMIRNANGEFVWLSSPADRNGNLPFQGWPAWRAGVPEAARALNVTDLTRTTVSFSFQDRHTVQQAAVPIRGVIEQVATDEVLRRQTRFVSELQIATPTAGNGDLPGADASIVAVVVVQKLIDQAALEQVARRTGKLPALFSPDLTHRQQLRDAHTTSAKLLQDLFRAAGPAGVAQHTVKTREGSFYETVLPWQFEGQQPLILSLALSRASTFQHIREAVTAILVVAGLVLLVSIALGMFWVNRFINPIVELTSAAKRIEVKRRASSEPVDAAPPSVEELRPIEIDAPDEVGDLAQAFNAMIAALRDSFETLEHRVQDRTAELRQQTRYLRTLIDTLPLLVWLKDTQSRYLAVNQAVAKGCGRTTEEMVGKSDLDFWPRELAEAYRADDLKAMETRQRSTLEERVAGVNGMRWIETYKAPVLDEDGTVLGTVGAARDISDRKATETAREAALAEAERLARLRSEFLAQMSHELRTPLNAILGYAQLLQQHPQLTEVQARGLATIKESGQHLLNLINDILDLSRLGASKLELHPSDVDLAAFLRLIADIVRVKADEKTLLFVYEPAPDLPATVRVDDGRLRQILLNLLGNAVKFTDAGRVALRVCTLPQSPEDALHATRLRFEVEDTGIGMSEEQVARIFEPFEQVGDINRRRGGAGLGLAISRQLVRLMGAEIHIRSAPGQGSRFWFDVELPRGESTRAVLPIARAVTGYAGPRKRILVVDDVAENRVMLCDMLSLLGFELTQAANGQEALQTAAAAHPDLIVMDMMMPVMDGLEATRRIRAAPALARVPVIIVSASVSRGDASSSFIAGASAFLPKPVNREQLLERIGEQLALGWIYAVTPPERQQGTDELIVPPAEEIEILHRLALTGSMRDIRERADHLQHLDPRFAAFAERLDALAQRYQSQAIVTFIDRFRGTDQQGASSEVPQARVTGRT